MRIFDADTHMSPYKNFPEAIDANQWNDILQDAGVERALCWLLPQEVTDVSESNRYLYENAKNNPRMVPFGWANVGGEGLEKSLREVDTCLLEYGFAGVKINGAQNAYFIDGDEATQVALRIAELGGILAYHIGADEPDYTAARRAANVARQIPNTPVLMIHMGGAISEDISEEVIAVAADHPNMHLIGSAISVDKVANAIRTLGAERVMFGSDIPFFDVKANIAAYLTLAAEFGQEALEKVMYGNAQKLFKL